jgi:tRNA A-37 threonylcarbamoyl transferase component Bud32
VRTPQWCSQVAAISATRTPPHFRLVARENQRGLLDLPWAVPLEKWPAALVVEVERGIGRHVVRFVELNRRYYALKELPPRIAEREYRLIRALDAEGMPAVEAAGIVAERIGGHGEALESVLITRVLEFALPYRLILGRTMLPAPETSIRAALAELLVRLHLSGFFWGDCSLSNALFRRDAGALSAYLVDAETGEMHEKLSDGQRLHDVEIAEENLVGELYDLAAELERDVVDDPGAFAEDVRVRYERLWAELTREEVFAAGEGQHLEERLRRLNELGFDVEEVELVSDGGEVRLRLHSKVVEPGHHRRRLLRLTGLDTQENQARRLLNDLTRFKAFLERTTGAPVSDAAAAGAWLSDVFEPTIASIPRELLGKRAAAEIFHEILEHRWFLSERAGRDVGLRKATESYIEQVLRKAPDEKLPIV